MFDIGSSGLSHDRIGMPGGVKVEVTPDVGLAYKVLKNQHFPKVVLIASEIDKLVAKFSPRVAKALR